MTLQRRISKTTYSDQEKQVLLTGVPLHATSTRFGHPFHGGWNRDEIRAAWALLGDELRIEWQGERFDHYRSRDPRPFAERILTDD